MIVNKPTTTRKCAALLFLSSIAILVSSAIAASDSDTIYSWSETYGDSDFGASSNVSLIHEIDNSGATEYTISGTANASVKAFTHWMYTALAADYNLYLYDDLAGYCGTHVEVFGTTIVDYVEVFLAQEDPFTVAVGGSYSSRTTPTISFAMGGTSFSAWGKIEGYVVAPTTIDMDLSNDEIAVNWKPDHYLVVSGAMTATTPWVGTYGASGVANVLRIWLDLESEVDLDNDTAVADLELKYQEVTGLLRLMYIYTGLGWPITYTRDYNYNSPIYTLFSTTSSLSL